MKAMTKNGGCSLCAGSRNGDDQTPGLPQELSAKAVSDRSGEGQQAELWQPGAFL